jgi:hypothetical protein
MENLLKSYNQLKDKLHQQFFEFVKEREEFDLGETITISYYNSTMGEFYNTSTSKIVKDRIVTKDSVELEIQDLSMEDKIYILELLYDELVEEKDIS